MGLVNNSVVPAFNTIEDQLEVSKGEARANPVLELEVLGNDIELVIATTLNVGVDTELVRAWVAKMVMADFASFAIKAIVNGALDIVIDSGVVTFRSEAPPPIIGFMIGEVGTD